MADILIAKLKQEIKKQRFNYKSLSLAAGMGETAIRDIITGRARNPRRDTLQKIAAALGKSVSYFLNEEILIPFLAAEGVSGTFQEHDQAGPAGEYAPAPPESMRDMVAIRITGDHLAPFLPEGTIVYCLQPKKTVTPEDMQHLCAVQTLQGERKVGIVKPASYYGSYDLFTYSGKLIASGELEWCARVLFIKPL